MKVSITREQFIDIVNSLKKQRDRNRQIAKNINAICSPNGENQDVIFTTPLEEEVIAFLEEILCLKVEGADGNTWLSYFIYELDYGDSMLARHCIKNSDGTTSGLTSVGQLYDFILQVQDD